MKTFDIDVQIIRGGYDRKTCFVHARPAVIPGDPPVGVITMSKMRLSGDDVFYSIHDMRSDDGGATWSEPVEHADTLGRRPIDCGMVEMCTAA